MKTIEMTSNVQPKVLAGQVSYVDEQGNTGECSLQEMIDAHHDMGSGDPLAEPEELDKLRALKVGESVRLTGWLGMFFDVTRIA